MNTAEYEAAVAKTRALSDENLAEVARRLGMVAEAGARHAAQEMNALRAAGKIGGTHRSTARTVTSAANRLAPIVEAELEARGLRRK